MKELPPSDGKEEQRMFEMGSQLGPWLMEQTSAALSDREWERLRFHSFHGPMSVAEVVFTAASKKAFDWLLSLVPRDLRCYLVRGVMQAVRDGRTLLKDTSL